MPHSCPALRLAAGCAALFLASCSVYQLPGSEPAPVVKEPPYTPVEPPATSAQPKPGPAGPNTSGAYRGLIDRADAASARGDYEQALALLERAQRIDPDSGAIYLSLAETYRAKGDEALAAATAERGLLYCSDRAQCDSLRAFVR